MLQVQRETLLFTVDSDLIPNVNAYATLTTGKSRPLLISVREKWRGEGRMTAIIVPTFEKLRVGDSRIVLDEALTLDDVTPSCEPSDKACWMYQIYNMPATKERLKLMAAKHGDVQPFYAVRVRALSDEHRRSPTMKSVSKCCILYTVLLLIIQIL